MVEILVGIEGFVENSRTKYFKLIWKFAIMQFKIHAKIFYRIIIWAFPVKWTGQAFCFNLLAKKIAKRISTSILNSKKNEFWLYERNIWLFVFGFLIFALEYHWIEYVNFGNNFQSLIFNGFLSWFLNQKHTPKTINFSFFFTTDFIRRYTYLVPTAPSVKNSTIDFLFQNPFQIH